MDKRRAARYKRRIQLRFWSHDDRNPRKGFTQNVSVSGMFVSTNQPFKPGTRVFLELPSGQDKLVLQGEVRYSARVDPVLQKVMPSGMGVRLLRVDEVMAEILKIKSASAAVVELEATEAADETAGTEEPEDHGLEGGVFPTTFETPHDLATSYERDIKYGGLFVPSSEPADQDAKVIIEFRFGWDVEQIVQVQALVVKKFASAEGSVAGEAVSGMGVAFSDPADVMAQFSAVFSALDRGDNQL